MSVTFHACGVTSVLCSPQKANVWPHVADRLMCVSGGLQSVKIGGIGSFFLGFILFFKCLLRLNNSQRHYILGAVWVMWSSWITVSSPRRGWSVCCEENFPILLLAVTMWTVLGLLAESFLFSEGGSEGHSSRDILVTPVIENKGKMRMESTVPLENQCNLPRVISRCEPGIILTAEAPTLHRQSCAAVVWGISPPSSAPPAFLSVILGAAPGCSRESKSLSPLSVALCSCRSPVESSSLSILVMSLSVCRMGTISLHWASFTGLHRPPYILAVLRRETLVRLCTRWVDCPFMQMHESRSPARRCVLQNQLAS